jgi:competence protein ComEC
LITLPSGYQILVDGGPDQSVLSSLRQSMSAGDRFIDVVMLTHGDADHLTGLVDVLKDYEVGLVMMPDAPKTTNLYKAWQELIVHQEVQIITGRMDIALSDGATIRVLHPTMQTFGDKDSVNDASIVFRLDYGETSFLFTGDIESEIERRLVEVAGDELDVDVFKVPHHGSKTSSTAAFLEAVTPEISVIQVGLNNRYNHPDKDVLSRLIMDGDPVFRTDQQGSIRLQSDGCQIERVSGFSLFAAGLVGKTGEKVYNSCQDR